MTTETRIAKLVTFGEGGDMVYYSRNCRCTGYGNPENPHAAKGENIPDGTPAIDKRPAIKTKAGFSWVFRGPMVDVDLPAGEIDRLPEPSPIMASAMAHNAYGTLLALQKSHRSQSSEPGPLDSVDIQTYIEGWRKAGARIGAYRNGTIIWG